MIEAEISRLDGGDKLVKLRDLADICKLIEQAADMDGQPTVVDIICLVTEQIEHLGVHNRHDEIEGIIRIGNDDEQCRLTVSRVSVPIRRSSSVPQLCNVKGCKSCATGNQDRFCCFASRELVFSVLFNRKVIRVSGFQLIEHDVHWVSVFIVLSGLRSIDHFEQCGEIFSCSGASYQM